MINLLLEILWYITSPFRVTYYKPCLGFCFSCRTYNYFGNLNSSLKLQTLEIWEFSSYFLSLKLAYVCICVTAREEPKKNSNLVVWSHHSDTGRKIIGAFSGWLFNWPTHFHDLLWWYSAGVCVPVRSLLKLSLCPAVFKWQSFFWKAIIWFLEINSTLIHFISPCSKLLCTAAVAYWRRRWKTS